MLVMGKKLAIKGHSTRSKEVIELLEMLGGENEFEDISFITPNIFLYINDDYYSEIEWDYIGPEEIEKYKIFTLEEFLEKFPYKVGDKVTLDKYPCVIIGMNWDCDDIIYYVKGMDFSKGVYSTDKDLQPYKEETMEDKPNLLEQLKEYFENTPREVVEKEWHEYDKYNEIGPSVEEYLEYVSNIRQPQYPKTYEECCKVLGYSGNYNMILTTDIDCKLFNALYRLKVCRDAYWKIAGDWKPDFLNPTKEIRYFLFCTGTTIENGQGLFPTNKILIFPTEEMRNKFYENFKDLIEQCKELL